MTYREKRVCELCERAVNETTLHHLVPKGEGGSKKSTVELCIPCHRQVHALYTNRHLALRLNTLEKLKNDERILRYLRWLRKQDVNEAMRVKRSRAVRMGRR